MVKKENLPSLIFIPSFILIILNIITSDTLYFLGKNYSKYFYNIRYDGHSQK
jgi:hypothetical protein